MEDLVTIGWFIAWLIGINLVTYAVFGLDKRAARLGGRRVPEKTLLGLAAAGGWPGAKVAQRMFRHKTNKQPFGLLLNVAPIIPIGAVVFWIYDGMPKVF